MVVESNESDLFSRAFGLLVIEILMCNPNGDPDNGGSPRVMSDGRGKVSRVSSARKLRDLIGAKDAPAFEILGVDADGNPLPPEQFEILEEKGRDRAAIAKMSEEEFVSKYWDARVLGRLFLEGSNIAEYFKCPGVVQIGTGLSVARVDLDYGTYTNKAGVEEGKDQGMAPDCAKVVHGVYLQPFTINPNIAYKAGCTKQDIDLFLRVLPHIFDLTVSSSRTGISLRHLWYCEHKNVLCSFREHEVLAALTPRRKGEDPMASSTCWEDYDVPTIDDEAFAELRKHMAECKDLVEVALAAAQAA